MASHVFVVDGRVRKIRIQTTQGTYLSDVLEQGCKKLGLKPDQFVLKYVFIMKEQYGRISNLLT
jgi:tether containing UBX domain for GLUT4